MKFLLSTFIFVNVYSSCPTFAADTLAPEDVRLLGRPLMERHTGVSLGLHCVHFEGSISNCDSVQFVRFDPNEPLVKAIGPVIPRASGQEGENFIKHYLHDLKKDTKEDLRDPDRGKEIFLGFFIGACVAIPASMVLHLIPPSSLYALGLVVVTGVAGALSFIPFDFPGLAEGISAGKVIRTTRDQNGWNWSVRPRKITRRRFEAILENIPYSR